MEWGLGSEICELWGKLRRAISVNSSDFFFWFSLIDGLGFVYSNYFEYTYIFFNTHYCIVKT